MYFSRNETHKQFSFMCCVCGKPILSNAVDGQDCILVFVQDGTEVERLEGKYNGFGGVFIDDKCDLERKQAFWKTDWALIQEKIDDWMDESSGISASHKWCFDGSITISQQDTDDGWGLNIWKNSQK